jgi:hypothetical protein
MDNVTVTVDAAELRLLDVQSMAEFKLLGDLFLPFLDIPMTVDAVLIDEFVLCRKFVGEELARLGMAVHTGDPGRMDRLGPHHDSGLLDVTVETYGWVGHEKMPRSDNKGYPQNDDTWKNTEEKPFFLDQIDDGPLYEVSDFHGSDSSSVVLR